MKLISEKYKLEFEIGQIVYLKTDKEQRPKIITGITLRQFNCVLYGLTENSTETWHYYFEIINERDILLATSN